jgi:hypothetical protein
MDTEGSFTPNVGGYRLLPQNKMLPERIVEVDAFGEGFENSIKFILDGLS